jgi:predicted dehydrogenase
MLDPAIAGGGCLRNLGAHGLDIFLALTGEQATVTGAQLGWGAHRQPVEDYASVLLSTPSGILGTVEVGNTVPGQAGDGEWKLSGRDAMLVMRGSAMRVVTASGEKTIDAQLAEPVFATALRDTIDRWQRGEQPLTSAEDCWRVQCLVDRAYELAGDPYGNARARG